MADIMSDFIYTTEKVKPGNLTREIQSIYSNYKPTVEEFHGKWGCLAISNNLYKGFEPYETIDHIFVVIGGPVLNYKENYFLGERNSNSGTQEIYSRWKEGSIKWDEDL